MSLGQAQQAELDPICRKLRLRPGERFLDIDTGTGTGWGALLPWAAEHCGARAHGITLSRNQHAHVNALTRRRAAARLESHRGDARGRSRAARPREPAPALSARTPWARSDALEARLATVRTLTSARVVRAHRVYLTGSAMGFEQGWTALFQKLAAQPSGRVGDGPMPGAQSQYPFNRAYLYEARD